MRNAEGHVVTPGFVDGHTHLDAQIFWDARGTNSCWHGVTTAVMGNCGFTLAPVRPAEHALVVRNLERAEDIDPAALAAGIDWIDVRPEVMDAYNAQLRSALDSVEVWQAGCSHYYLSGSGLNVTQNPVSMFFFRDALAALGFAQFEVGRRGAPVGTGAG